MYLTSSTVGQDNPLMRWAEATEDQLRLGTEADKETLRQRFYWFTLGTTLLGTAFGAISYPMFVNDPEPVQALQWASWGLIIGLIGPFATYSIYKTFAGKPVPGPIQPEFPKP